MRERIAEGVWLVRGGFPLKTMNVYLIEDDGGGVTMFDAGIKAMSTGLAAAAATLGGLNRIVLGNSHPDHRGAAPALQMPTLCHPVERVFFYLPLEHAESMEAQEAAVAAFNRLVADFLAAEMSGR